MAKQTKGKLEKKLEVEIGTDEFFIFSPDSNSHPSYEKLPSKYNGHIKANNESYTFDLSLNENIGVCFECVKQHIKQYDEPDLTNPKIVGLTKSLSVKKENTNNEISLDTHLIEELGVKLMTAALPQYTCLAGNRKRVLQNYLINGPTEYPPTKLSLKCSSNLFEKLREFKK